MRSRLRSFLAISIAALLVLAPSQAIATPQPLPAETGTPVIIPDPMFKRCLAEFLEVDPASTLTTTQLATVEGLFCSGDGTTPINNLSGLEHLVNLTVLALPDNRLTSVTIPGTLTKLEMVDLSNNRLTSLVISSALTKLGFLAVDDNQLTALNIPSTLTFLSGLSASHNRLTRFTVPGTLTGLEFLDLSVNHLSSLTIPNSLNNLQGIYATNNKLTSIVLPAKLNHLRELDLTDNHLGSITLPGYLPTMSELRLDRNRLSDLTKLNQLGHLAVFSATGQTVMLSDTRLNTAFRVPLSDREGQPEPIITAKPGVTSRSGQLIYHTAGTYQLTFGTVGGTFSGTVIQKAVALASTPNEPPTGRFGDHSGDGIADVFAIDDRGALLYFTGSSTGAATFDRVSGDGWGDMTYLAQIDNITGDTRSDLLTRRGADNSLFIYPAIGGGVMTSAILAGKNWGGMDQIVPVGNLAGDSTQYVVGRRASDGALFRYTVTTRGLTNIKHIGQNWNGMKQLLSVGDFNRDGYSDLLAIREDGTLWAYYGTSTGGIGHARQVGRGWNNFVQAFSPGDLSGDGVRDLVGQRADGVVFTYANRGGSWGSARQIMTGTITYRLMA